MNTKDVIDIIDFKERKLKLRVELTTGIISLLVVLVFGTILGLNGFSHLLILIIIALFVFPGLILHEGSHYLLQWYFSKEKPYFGFKFPFPFSALSPSSSITRNQAILCALAPVFVVTPILVIPALFAPLLLKILLLAWASIELASCYGDFYLTYRLLKNPSNCLLKNVNLSNVLFKPKS
jgi:hypothetical protein